MDGKRARHLMRSLLSGSFEECDQILATRGGRASPSGAPSAWQSQSLEMSKSVDAANCSCDELAAEGCQATWPKPALQTRPWLLLWGSERSSQSVAVIQRMA
jgi:hypothetical protein